MKEQHEKYSLPEGWVWTTIGELGIVTSGGTPSTKEPVFWADEIPWITPSDLSGYKEKYISKGNRNISKIGLANSSALLLPKGSLLFSSRAPIGYIVISQNELATNQGFKNLIPVESTFVDYIYYYLQFAKQDILSLARGTTFLELSAKSFSSISIPLPPLNEQNRIVLKLEEILSSLEKSKEQLVSSLKQLGSYKQSILKQASEGTLTKEWRKNQNDLKTPQQIVKEINVYQEERYKKEIRYFDAIKNKLKPRKPKKIQISSDAEALATLKLPKEWSYIQLKDVCHIVERVRLKQRDSEDKFIYIDIGGINNNKNIIETYKEYQWKDAPSRAQYIVEVNDILFSTVRTYLKNIAMIEEEKFNHQIASLGFAVIRVFDSFIDPKYIFKYIISDNFIQPLNELQSGSSYPAVRASDVFDQFIPICSKEEQNAIIEELDRQFSIINHFESTIEKNLLNIESLKQSVLRNAFEGKLSEQDSNDESARILLERIKVEKEEYLAKEKENRNNSIKVKTMPEKLKSILEILNESIDPISSKQLWLSSDKRDDIEELYAELKKHIKLGDIIELQRNGKESFLKLANKS